MSTSHLTPSRTYSPLVILLGICIPVVLLFVLAEVTIRIINPDVSYKNQFFPLNRDIDFTDVYQNDARLFWRFRPNHTIDSRQFSDISYRINSRGMRNPEFANEPAGFRIIAIGNSCTFGWGVEENNIWARRLETSLREKLPDKSIEVIDAGVPGYSSFQGKRYFADELIALKPRMVLIMFGWNDQWTAGRKIADKDHRELPGILIWLQNQLNRLKLYALLRKVVLTQVDAETLVRFDDTSEPRRVSLPDFNANLKEIIQTARQNNILPVLLIPPIASLTGYFGGGRSDFHTRHRLYQQKIAEVAATEGVMLINLQPPFDQFTNFYDDAQGDPIHFNSAGHGLAAQVISDSIAPIIVSLK